MYLVKIEDQNDTVLSLPIYGQTIINYQYEMVNCSQQKYLMPMRYKDESLNYVVTGLMPYELYFDRSCKGYTDLKKICIDLISAVESCESYLLNMQYLNLEKDAVYYNAEEGAIQFVYYPFEHTSGSLHQRIKQLILSLIYEHDLFVDWIKEERIKNLIKSLQDQQFDAFLFKQLLLKDSIKRKDKTWFSKLFSKPIDYSIEKTICMESNNWPVLEFGNKVVALNKNIFLIGRSESLSDFAMPDCLSLGRVHVEIITENNQCYIVDINTKNGTFVNGVRINSQERVLLKQGDEIRMASETAIYK